MRTKGNDAEAGLLLVDKPAGPTSHDIVQAARRALRIRRIGHTGTLDPFADGLLLLAVGRMTRLVEYFHVLPKEYEAELVFGIETDTHDSTGEVTARSDSWCDIDPAAIEDTLKAFVGEFRQVPPAHSAKKVGGERSYAAAREGRSLALAPADVRIFGLEPLELAPPRLRFRTRVSTGTYIRALARDLGSELGCGAHLTALRRIAIGPFQVEDALPGDELGEGRERQSPHWLTPAAAVGWLPGRELEDTELDLVRTGRRVPRGSIGRGSVDEHPPETTGDGRAESPVALFSEGQLIGVAERDGDELQPRKVLDVG